MRFVRFALCVVLFCSVIASPAAAASTPGGTQTAEDAGCTEPITDQVDLCSKSWDEESSTAEITVYVNQSVAVTVSDGLGWQDADQREISQKSGIILDPGRNTISLSATEWKNKVVLLLDDGEMWVPIRVLDGDSGGDLGILPGQPQTTDPVVAGASIFLMFAAGFPLAVLFVRRHMGGIFDEW